MEWRYYPVLELRWGMSKGPSGSNSAICEQTVMKYGRITIGGETSSNLLKQSMIPSTFFIWRHLSFNAGINFIHNHPPAHPWELHQKFALILGLLHSSFCPGGGRGFVGIAPEERAFVYKRFLPFSEFPL